MDIKVTRGGTGYKGHATYRPGADPALLPCPHCGGEDVEVGHTHTPFYVVACNGCGAECGTHHTMKLRDNLKSADATRETHRRGFLAAIEAWNRRAPSVGQAAGLEAAPTEPAAR